MVWYDESALTVNFDFFILHYRCRYNICLYIVTLSIVYEFENV